MHSFVEVFVVLALAATGNIVDNPTYFMVNALRTFREAANETNYISSREQSPIKRKFSANSRIGDHTIKLFVKGGKINIANKYDYSTGRSSHHKPRFAIKNRKVDFSFKDLSKITFDKASKLYSRYDTIYNQNGDQVDRTKRNTFSKLKTEIGNDYEAKDKERQTDDVRDDKMVMFDETDMDAYYKEFMKDKHRFDAMHTARENNEKMKSKGGNGNHKHTILANDFAEPSYYDNKDPKIVADKYTKHTRTKIEPTKWDDLEHTHSEYHDNSPHTSDYIKDKEIFNNFNPSANDFQLTSNKEDGIYQYKNGVSTDNINNNINKIGHVNGKYSKDFIENWMRNIKRNFSSKSTENVYKKKNSKYSNHKISLYNNNLENHYSDNDENINNFDSNNNQNKDNEFPQKSGDYTELYKIVDEYDAESFREKNNILTDLNKNASDSLTSRVLNLIGANSSAEIKDIGLDIITINKTQARHKHSHGRTDLVIAGCVVVSIGVLVLGGTFVNRLRHLRKNHIKSRPYRNLGSEEEQYHLKESNYSLFAESSEDDNDGFESDGV